MMTILNTILVIDVGTEVMIIKIMTTRKISVVIQFKNYRNDLKILVRVRSWPKGRAVLKLRNTVQTLRCVCIHYCSTQVINLVQSDSTTVDAIKQWKPCSFMLLSAVFDKCHFWHRSYLFFVFNLTTFHILSHLGLHPFALGGAFPDSPVIALWCVRT